ncbi:MAG: hypothetical protein HY817_02360 [Candidatus Abawacabacteria bacterium]|nr:hypothetical protein [Candidatus Abawacabacteria bacterium]
MQTIYIVISSVLALISPIVYARAILRGEAKPHRTTRFVLLVITALSTASLLANNNTVAVWLAGVSTLQAIIIFALSIKHGMGGWAKLDILCLIIAVVGIIVWQTTNNPILGLYFSILADFTGMIPAIIKTYRFPKTEIVTFFLLDTIAAVFTLFAIDQLILENIAYPIYIFVINLIMCALIVAPRMPNERMKNPVAL